MKKSCSLFLLLSITFIFGQNTSPVANNQTVSTDKYSPVTVSLIATDAENDVLTYIVKSLPTNGTLKNGSAIISSSDLPIVLSSNKITYTPTGDYSGTDSFNFVARDLSLGSFAAANNIKFITNNGIPVTYKKAKGNL